MGRDFLHPAELGFQSCSGKALSPGEGSGSVSHFLSPDRATRVSFLDPYNEYLVGFFKSVSLTSCSSIFSFQRVIKITKCFFNIMVLYASAPARQILIAVSLWIYLSLQILGWHLPYHPNSLMGLNKVFNFRFVQRFLIVKMGVKTSKMFICQS